MTEFKLGENIPVRSATCDTMFMVKESKLKVTSLVCTDRQNMCTIEEIEVAESNGGVRILTGISQVAILPAHLSHIFAKISPERLVRHRAAFKLQCVATATFFLVLPNPENLKQ